VRLGRVECGLEMTTLPIALFLAGIVVALRLIATTRSDADRHRLADESLLERYVRLPKQSIPYIRMALLAIGVIAMTLAMRSGRVEERRTDPEGAETILVLDASNSMLATDVEPNRLQQMRLQAGRLATRIPGQIGVIYFAGRAYVLSPLTTDISAVEMLVEGVRPAAVGLGGSSLAAGITQAIDLLAGGAEDTRKSIVVFSDGEETSGQSINDAIGRARETGIIVHAVGFGTEVGGQIPLTREASLDPSTASRRRGRGAVLQGPDGQPVVTRLEEASLQRASSATGGRYVRSTDGVIEIERELVSGSLDPLSSGSDSIIGVLLFVAFVSLWAEAFLLPRG